MEFHKLKLDLVNYVKCANLKEQMKLFLKFKMDTRRFSQNIWFLQQCLKRKLCPRFVNLKCNANSYASTKAIRSAKIIWIKEEVKTWFSKRDNLFVYIKVLHGELAFKLHFIELESFMDMVRDKAKRFVHKKYIIQKRKLQRLKVSQQQHLLNNNGNMAAEVIPVGDLIFEKRTINLTTIDFTSDELNVLNKGTKYSPPSIQCNRDTLIVDAVIATSDSKDNLSKELVKKVIQEHIQLPRPARPSQFNCSGLIKSIKTKMQVNNAILTRADKGGSTIILPKQEYINKVGDFIYKERIQRLNADPTNKFQVEIKKCIGNSKALFSDKDRYGLSEMNPRSPTLYGLVKTHKPDCPIRPVVSYIGSPGYRLSKVLNCSIRLLTNFQSPHSIKNSIDLVDKIKNFKMQTGFKLGSLDIVNMFSNIPIPVCINLIVNMLEKRSTNPLIVRDVVSLLNTTLKQNYFCFNNKFFKQTAGLAMGSPLSPLLAEIFMADLEHTILNLDHAKSRIKFWYRYVDDILICTEGTDRQMEGFLEVINSLNPKIKFTFEKEENNSINFLDLTITKIDDRLSFNIYRKKTFTDVTIPMDSQHPLSHKLAAYNSMIHRAFNIPLSNVDFSAELRTIKRIAFNNGYEGTLIDNLIKKKQHQMTLTAVVPSTPIGETIYKGFTYFGVESIKIKRILEKIGIHLAFRPPVTLGQILNNNKGKTDSLAKSGVYQLSCGECEGVYIGQTGRSFKTRRQEHQRAYRLHKKDDSTYASHLLDTSHKPDWDMQVLHVAGKGRRLHTLEALEIYKTSKGTNTLLNDQTDLMFSTFFPLSVD